MLKRFLKNNLINNSSFLQELYKPKFNKQILQELILNKKININFKDSKGNSYLNNCILDNKFESALWLIEQGIDVTIENNKNQSSFHLCLENENPKILSKILQQEKININEKDKFGRIPLQDLVVDGKIELAKLLIKFGADINSQDKHHRNVIFDALSYGDENFIVYLLSLDDPKIDLNNVDDNLNTIMHHSEVTSNDTIAEKLIDAGADVTIKNAKGETFLCNAALRGEQAKKLVELALQKGADVNSKVNQDNTIFIELMKTFAQLPHHEVDRRRNLLEMAKLIINYGGDIDAVNADHETALFQAIRARDFTLISYLLKLGVNPNIINKYGRTVLLEVVYQGIESLDILLLLLEYGADPIIKNLKGQTIFETLNDIILHTHQKKYLDDDQLISMIDLNGQYMVLLKELLKQNKADLNFLGASGQPLFFEPLLYDDGQLFRLYLNTDINLHMTNKAGHNLFYEYVLKVFQDNNTTVKFQDNLSRLISKKINHNFQDALGWTVLHKIMETKSNENLFEILVKIVKFDLTITDNLGRTALHNAIWHNNHKMIAALNKVDYTLINKEDIYGITPIKYAALLGSQSLVLLIISLKAEITGGYKIPQKAAKKFNPMLQNLPKLKENLTDEYLIERIDTLIRQIYIDFGASCEL